MNFVRLSFGVISTKYMLIIWFLNFFRFVSFCMWNPKQFAYYTGSSAQQVQLRCLTIGIQFNFCYILKWSIFFCWLFALESLSRSMIYGFVIYGFLGSYLCHAIMQVLGETGNSEIAFVIVGVMLCTFDFRVG